MSDTSDGESHQSDQSDQEESDRDNIPLTQKPKEKPLDSVLESDLTALDIGSEQEDQNTLPGDTQEASARGTGETRYSGSRSPADASPSPGGPGEFHPSDILDVGVGEEEMDALDGDQRSGSMEHTGNGGSAAGSMDTPTHLPVTDKSTRPAATGDEVNPKGDTEPPPRRAGSFVIPRITGPVYEEGDEDSPRPPPTKERSRGRRGNKKARRQAAQASANLNTTGHPQGAPAASTAATGTNPGTTVSSSTSAGSSGFENQQRSCKGPNWCFGRPGAERRLLYYPCWQAGWVETQ